MKTALCLTLLVCLIALSSSAASVGFFKDPNYPGKCAISSSMILSPGEEVKDPNVPCGRIVCQSDSAAEFQSCGVAAPPPGCKFLDYIDASLDYPQCCEKKLSC